MAGERMPTWMERENNKRRERRRRAIATKIYAGLRLYGNYNLPKHCDNNEVLKALCQQAGWIVQDDGTTFRKGCKPPVESMDATVHSVSVSPCSSYQPSPLISYDPSPNSSSFPSPAHYTSTTNGTVDANSLIPWLKNLSSSSASASPKLPHLYIPGGSISAPVTPPSSSPTSRSPRIMMNHTDWDDTNAGPPWATNQNYSLPTSTPPSPGRQVLPEPAAWFANVQALRSGPNSPTFSFVSRNQFGVRDESMGGGGSQMWTPGQSGTCSPAVAAGLDHTADVPMADGIAAEFAFGSCSTMGVVKAWEGERIHEECIPDELELKL